MRYVALLLVSSLLLVVLPPTAAALTDPQPANSQWIAGLLIVTQPDLTTMDISGALTIHKYAIQGTSYRTSDDMGNAYQQLLQADAFARQNGQTSNRAQQFVDDLAANATSALKDTLVASFPGATVTTQPSVVDTSTLPAPSGDPYLPGVQLLVTAKVVRSISTLGAGNLSLPAINAAFDAGAVVSSSLDLSAGPGQDLTYVVSPPAKPAGLVFSDASGTGVTVSDGNVVAHIDASALTTKQTTKAAFKLSSPAAILNAPKKENISQTITIALSKPQKGSDKLPIDVKVDAAISAIDVAKRFGTALPASVKLSILSADGFRALHEADAITDATLDKANADLLGSVKENLTNALGDAGTVTGAFTESDLHLSPASPFATTPPIHYVANAQSNYKIPGDHAKDADVALDIGAIVKFDVSLFSSTRDTTFLLKAPTGVIFTSASSGTLTSDGKTITIPVPANAAAPKVGIGMRASDAPTFTAQKADIGVVVDLKDLDITIGKATKGDLGNLIVDVTITGNLGVIQVPDDLKASLGSQLSLDFVSSDAIRLLKSRGLLTDKNLSDLEAGLVKKVSENLAGSMGGPVTVTGGLDKTTLDAPVSSPLSGDKPIIFRATASFSKPISGGGAPVDRQALALYTVSQSFDLPKVQGLATGYTVILPKGLAVGSVTATGGEAKQGTAPDGRDQFTVTPGDNGPTKATVAIAVTPTFVMAKFWPIVLLAVLVIVLLVGTPIALVVRSKNKKKAAKK